MRFPSVSLLALPLLVAAAEEPSVLDQTLNQFKAQAQIWYNKISAFIPNPNQPHTPQAAAAKVGGKSLNVLTLDNWEHTVRSSVKPASTTPEEWWVMVTGGNKTCFGHCSLAETAFNETALLWSVKANAPNLGYLDCDNQPVLCNSWGAGPPSLWIMEVGVPGTPVDIRIKALNATTTTVQTFTDLYASKDYKEKAVYEGYFHPFDGPLAKYGLAVPLGYIFWVMAVVPSWVIMIGISFISRKIMSSRTNPNPNRPAGAAAAGGAPRARVGAQPGDGISY